MPGSIFLTADNFPYEVLSVSSDTSLLLASNYTGASTTGVPYRVVPTQSYILDLSAQVASLLGQFGDLKAAWQSGDLHGAGLALRGVLTDPSQLPTTNQQAGDAYLIASSLYVWVGTTWKSSSIRGDVGPAGPPSVVTAVVDASRNAGTLLPNSYQHLVRWDFAVGTTAGTGGNYAGVMTVSPYTGATVDGGDGSYQRFGFVAQELDTVFPEAVSKPTDPEEMMGVDYSKLVPLLVKEVQNLRKQIAQLTTTRSL